jgi:tetratricopeptide (TPR) repeat protein
MPAQASRKEDGFQARMKAAAWLYEELEYEQALKALSQAQLLAKTDDEQAEVAVYQGIVLADLGHREKSLAAFRKGLSLRLEARLPVKVSPKVEQDFEAVRQAVRSEREAVARAKAPPPAAADRPVQTPTVATPAPPAPMPGADLGTPSLREERGRGIRKLPLALLGAGVVAGGVGSYLGLRSQGNIQDARDAFDSEPQQRRLLEDARGQALAANILFGVAITAAAGAAITYFTGKESMRAEEVSP